MPEKLADAQRRRAMASLEGWRKVRKREAIEKTYRFPNFSAAFAWMTKIAIRAEHLDHHPEWTNIYNRVTVVLTTHDAGGLTQRDIDLARYMDKSAGRAGKPKA